MTDVNELLAATKTIYLVDWPTRDVPDTLARSGLAVVSNDGPDEYNAYEVDGRDVRIRSVGQPPQRVDLMYTHRPIDELPEIVDTAKSMGARAVWIQSGRDKTGARDPHGCWMPQEDSRRARAIVEGSGLTYIETPYIAEAFRAR